MGSSSLLSALGDFAVSALDYVPATTVGLLLLLGTVCFLRIDVTEPTKLDATVFSLAMLTLSRTAFYEVLINKNMNPANAAVWSFVIALGFVTILSVMMCLGKFTMKGALLFAGAFLLFILFYNKDVMPTWIIIMLLAMGCLYACCRDQAHAMAFVIGSSLWLSFLLTYGVSYFISKDWTAFHDVAHDAQLGTSCWSARGCLIRTIIVLLLWILRSLAAAFCRCCLGDRTNQTELDKLTEQMKEIEERRKRASLDAESDSDSDSSSSSSSDSDAEKTRV
jgi:hypothetical protein